MFNSSILDVALGLIFVFLLVSLLVTIANEMVAAALVSRSKWLQKGITQLLGSAWMEKFYEHPLILGTTAKGAPGPSYIPSRAYAAVLLDLVAGHDGTVSTARAALQRILDQFPVNTGSVASLKAAVQKVVDDEASRLRDDLKAMLATMPGEGSVSQKAAGDMKSISALLTDPALAGVKQILDDLAHKIEQDASAYDSKRLRAELEIAIKAIPYIGVTTEALKKDLQDLMQHIGETGYSVGDAKRDIQTFVNSLSDRYMREMISRVPEPHLRKTLTVLLDDAQHNVEKFKENIEVWFNNAMDRVGGWYKRRSQLTTFILALILTVALNVDTLLIVHHLNTQPSVRDLLVTQARAFAEQPKSGLAARNNVPPPSSEQVKADFESIQSQLNQLSLPIGWFSASGENNAGPTQFQLDNLLVLPRTSMQSWNPWHWDDLWSDWLRNMSFHGIGWLLTALAASLGAPFWFDMLNKVMSIRSAGKAPEEKPRPPKEVPTPLEPGQSPREADRASALQRR